MEYQAAHIYSEYHATKSNKSIESKFESLTKEWKESKEKSLSGSIIQKSIHPAYQQIIGMGQDVVPLILRELSKDYDHWFWALNAITGENPVSPEDKGNIVNMTEAWLKWGKSKNLL
jgi:hypothetical protein